MGRRPERLHEAVQQAGIPKGAARHEAILHGQDEIHHHHSHADRSSHEGGHHLLQVEDLSISFLMYDNEGASFFGAKKQVSPVIRSLSLSVHKGEILAVVGASGAGKTLLADAIMGHFAPNSLVSGRIWFDGILLDAASLARLGGRGISLVPQNVNHLDPLMKVGKQVRGFKKRSRPGEGAAMRQDGHSFDKSSFRGQAAPLKGIGRRLGSERLLGHYGLPEKTAGLFPHQLSGGMARRVLLASALIDSPRLIIADEPTPGLDLPLAVQALQDFRAFADEGNGVVLITHDIELALHVADRVAVFKEGTVVEETAVANFRSPELLRHPFTRMLWHALPANGFSIEASFDKAAVSHLSDCLGAPAADPSGCPGDPPVADPSGCPVDPPEAAPSGCTSDPHAAAPSVPAEDSSLSPVDPPVADAFAHPAKHVGQHLVRAALKQRPFASDGEGPLLEARGLSFSYPGQAPLFSGFDLVVERGERVALKAPSGFGKTTLCAMLAGHLKPCGGEVLACGRPLPRKGVCPVQLIGQHPERMLDPCLRMDASLAESGPIQPGLLEALGIKEEWLFRFPHELSGGELQRFCIARALNVRPAIIIADEISTMLDALTQAQLWHFLIAEAKRLDMGLVFVSHSSALTAQVATRVLDLGSDRLLRQS